MPTFRQSRDFLLTHRTNYDKAVAGAEVHGQVRDAKQRPRGFGGGRHLAPELGIERVAQTLANQVEHRHHEEDVEARR